MSVNVQYTYKQRTMLLQKFKIIYRKQSLNSNLFNLAIQDDAKKALQNALTISFASYQDFSNLNQIGSNFIPAVNDPKEAEIVYLAAIVESKHASLVLINMFASFGVKLWVNDKCLLIQSNPGTPMFNGKIRLKKGQNIFLIEAHTRIDTDFQLSLIPYNQKEWKNSASFLRLPLEHNLPVFVHEPSYSLGYQQTTVMFVAGGVQEYFPQVEISLFDSQNSDAPTTLEAKMNEPTIVTLPPTLSHVKYRHICLEYTFTHVNGKKISQMFQMVLADDSPSRDALKKEIEALAVHTDLFTKDALMGHLFHTELLCRNPFGYYFACKAAHDLLVRIQDENYFPEEEKCKKNQWVWVRSKLDSRYVRIRVRMPENYNPSVRNYPAIIFISLVEFSDFSTTAPATEISEDCFFFDVSERGMTCGSYVGEAAFMEMWEWILNNYTVDPTRIYLCGYSAGAYAAWTLASIYPHLFAGIYTLGGLPDFRLTGNLNQVAVQTLASEEDYVLHGKNKKIREAFAYHRYFEQHFIPMTLHKRMGQYCCHPEPLNRLLSCKAITEPTEIHFRTDRNRHRQSYWITIHGLKEIGNYAEINATILSEKEIYVEAKNITGLTLQVPSVIDRQNFCVTINGIMNTQNNFNKSQLHFICTEEGDWYQTEKMPEVFLRHGTGLLDIYLDSMSIVVPDNAEETILNVARSWAAPSLSAIVPKVYTSYPIVAVASLSENTLCQNLLCFDIAGTNPLCRKLSLTVCCDSDGYTYLGERVNGDYLIFQCADNPYHKNRSVTVISTNNISMLKANFFTRKLILPSYIGGLHPYLNREILIWNGKKFLGTYMSGRTLQEVL